MREPRVLQQGATLSNMQYRTLGRTGLEVSIVGLGCGGPSRLGQRSGKTERESIALIRRALELGVNFVDTAEAYGTETLVGKAIHEIDRRELVISTKKTLPDPDHPDPAGEIRRGLEQSLRRLRTDYVDVYHLHGVGAERYGNAAEVLAPCLLQLKEEGKIRATGITEEFPKNPGHEMLEQAIHHDYWDVVMVGFNLLNPSARRRIFPHTLRRDIGTLIMFAVRRALSQPSHLDGLLDEMAETGTLKVSADEARAVLRSLDEGRGAASLIDAAYRFCIHEPGVDVVLMGTGEKEHLENNIASALKPSLPLEALEQIETVFGGIDSVTGN